MVAHPELQLQLFTMAHPFEDHLAARWPPAHWSRVTVLLAVSGGADSMALLRGIQAVRPASDGRVLVAHFNHRLRGAESDGDESFVREQAGRWGWSCVVGHAAEAARSETNEAAARQARYAFLRQAASESGARFLATAHTADDQAETILHRILRGTGLPGLAGILPAREFFPGVSLVRPLLAVPRTEVLEYLQSLGQPFRQDASNADSRFTRNRIRHELLPLLEREYHPRVRESLLRIGQLAGEAAAALSHAASQLSDDAVREVRPGEVAVDCRTIQTAPRTVACHLFMAIWRGQQWRLGEMTLEHWRQLAALAMSPGDDHRAMTLPGNIRAARDGSRLVLSAQRPVGANSRNEP